MASISSNVKLASCPWGPATANGVGLLTEMYVIYIERSTTHRAICLHTENQAPRSIGYGVSRCDGRLEEGRKES